MDDHSTLCTVNIKSKLYIMSKSCTIQTVSTCNGNDWISETETLHWVTLLFKFLLVFRAQYSRYIIEREITRA